MLESHRTDSRSSQCVNKTFFDWTGDLQVQGWYKDVFDDCVGRRVYFVFGALIVILGSWSKC